LRFRISRCSSSSFKAPAAPSTPAGRPVSGREGLIGETGTARTDLSPAGRVFVHGELWEAEAAEPVLAGEKVKVIGFLEGLKIKVGKA